MHNNFLGGISTSQFLRHYWQKKPLLIRKAFPHFQDLLTPDQLAGLAVEPNVKARLIFEKGRKPWQILHGPFSESQLSKLPKSHWSLLVSCVNEYLDGAAELLDKFNFIPKWRCDDLMVSFAPHLGTVGPHIDSYDVFLIQGLGSRKWQIQTKPNSKLIANIDIKVLQKFTAEDSWVLHPGDMLYLPPGVAHYGVALENCMTYSVGFRAPSQRAMLEELLNLPSEMYQHLRQDSENDLYQDPNLKPTKYPGLIDTLALEQIGKMLREPLTDPNIFGRWFGAYMSKNPQRIHPIGWSPLSAKASNKLALDKFKTKLAGHMIRRHDGVNLLYLPIQNKILYTYADGVEFALDESLQGLLETLTNRRAISGQDILDQLPKKSRLWEQSLIFIKSLVAMGAVTLEK